MTPKNLLEGSYPSAAVSSDRFLGLEGAVFEICTQFVPCSHLRAPPTATANSCRPRTCITCSGCRPCTYTGCRLHSCHFTATARPSPKGTTTLQQCLEFVIKCPKKPQLSERRESPTQELSPEPAQVPQRPPQHKNPANPPSSRRSLRQNGYGFDWF